MLEAQEELRTHDPAGSGSHESPRDKVKERLKEKRDKQRSPRTQQVPKVKPSHAATGPAAGGATDGGATDQGTAAPKHTPTPES
jgi:hypothetical protein